MNVAVVANDGDGDDGFVGERLAQLGASFDRLWREVPVSLATAETRADLIVLLGSDWSVYDPSVTRNVEAEKSLVQRAHTRGVPVLGICFGAQLSAAALGCRVVRAAQTEIGWRLLDGGDAPPFSTGPWFQYHADKWLEEGDVRSLMSNSVGPQAFVLDRLLGVQFHPEVTAATARRWLRAAPLEVEAAGESADNIEAETALLIDDARRRCYDLVDYFIDQVAT